MYYYNLGVRFYAVVEQWGDRTCLLFNDAEEYSFTCVNQLSNRLARFFLQSGVRPKEVICIAGKKDLFSYAALLACVKAGIIYSFFDPESPQERLRKIFRTCNPKLLLSPAEYEVDLLANEVHAKAVYWGESLDRSLQDLSPDNLAESRRVTGDDAAYIMFTSGSTGFPKGAVMTHNNVLNLINWSIGTYGFTPDDNLTNLNPLFFDNSVFDIYSAFFSGATLVPFSKQEATNPKILLEKIDQCSCTSWFSVPSLIIFLQTMKVFTFSNMRSIRRIIFGGEGYPKVKLKALFDLYKSRIKFHNVYGPTECTCICSTYLVSDNDFVDPSGLLPLGGLNENFRALIVDEENRSVPPGQQGELCLMGPCVGKGYYNDHERTMDTFIRNPQNKSYSEFAYKTGDLVRHNPLDGKLYILGRKDNQIKHMGYRIELEEIEAAICSLNKISQAAVVHVDMNGVSQLVAFISAESELSEKELKQQLKEIIPLYMVPHRYHFLDGLPKNPNGKVDRKTLKETYYSLRS